MRGWRHALPLDPKQKEKHSWWGSVRAGYIIYAQRHSDNLQKWCENSNAIFYYLKNGFCKTEKG